MIWKKREDWPAMKDVVGCQGGVGIGEAPVATNYFGVEISVRDLLVGAELPFVSVFSRKKTQAVENKGALSLYPETCT
jgi:hypothetical protein